MPFKAKDEFKAWRNIWQITQKKINTETLLKRLNERE